MGTVLACEKHPQSIRQIRHRIRDPLYRNSLFLMLNTITTSGLGFFFWMVVARFYTEAEVGLGAAIISVISLLALLSTLGLNIALIRFLPKAKRPEELINSCLTLSGITVLTLAAAFIAGIDFWSPTLNFVKGSIIFSLALASFALCWTLSGLLDHIFIAKRRADFVFSKNTISSLLKIPLPAFLAMFFHAFGIVASWGMAIGIALIFSFFFFLPKVQNPYKPIPRLNVSIIKGIWKYSVGNYLAILFNASPALILPIMVVNLLGAQKNAYFYVAWMIAGVLFAIPIAISQSLFAEGSHFEDKLRSNVFKSIKFAFLLLIPAIIILFLMGKWFLLLFGTNYSTNGLMLLWTLGLSSLFVGINSIYISILRIKNRLIELISISGFITTTVLLGSYFIMPAAGIVGIGYVWIVIQATVSIYVIVSMKTLQF